MKNKKAVLMKAVSQLQETDYSREPELGNIYSRLSTGRKQFAEIFEKNIKAVMQISSLDLTMQHQTDKITEISTNVARAAESIFGSSSDRSGAESNSRHEELTNSIIEVSSATEEIYQKIESGQEALTHIKELSSQTIEVSRELQADMDELSQIISHLSDVIAGIDSISMQTNLLALNASIEAARAGTAGRGFAVVAGEIRSLAEETQRLTSSMNEFVSSIRQAAQKSVQSAAHTIDSLDTVTDRIIQVWQLNDESQMHISRVNDSMSSIAAVSEEISSSMTQMENQLRDSTDFMNQVSLDLRKAVEPVVGIEHTLDETVKQMGTMTEDAFYHLENAEFAQYVNTAISAHQTWLSNLKKMVDSKSLIPLQLDSSKCGFGHFYYALTPQIPEVLPIWNALGDKHKRFHSYGGKVMNALKAEDYSEAVQIYSEAEEYSKELIADLKKILQISRQA
ncbi:MAG: methyl-accepting chemotaxis protein [Lachnospiraceae bacterium]|nr:methyl-accepting chemotaxis protein [Lachnospiraceae bacterium]